jgi:hypothetical protein
MLRKLEWNLAVLVTGIAVVLHVLFALHAGALWRDEAGVVNLATMPTLSDVWNNLYFDSFPVFWPVILRVWTAVGLGSDAGLRCLGLIIGLMILGTLWFNARVFRLRFPLFSVVLLGLSPTILIWCDSMRAWGLGAFWILLTMGLVWQVANSPSKWNVTLAAVCALAAVQSTYYNAVLLFAICVGGMAVTGLHRQWNRSLLIAGIGCVAAISLVPYLGIFQKGEEHYRILRAEEFGFSTFCQKIEEALSFGGGIGPWLWAVILVIALVNGISALLRPSAVSGSPIPSQRDLLLYSLSVLVIGVAGYFAFLHHLRFFTRPWYYAALLAIAGVALDALLSLLSLTNQGRRVRVVLAAAAVVSLFVPALVAARTRLTNLDLIARQLNQLTSDKDLVVINPWYCAIGFSRYYRGAAPWTGLPDVKDYRVHRYDVMREMMMNPNQTNVTAEVLGRMEATLKGGHQVWLVGGAEFLTTGGKPLILPAAPNSPWKWLADPYYQLWSEHTGILVQSHSAHYEWVKIPGSEHVYGLEHLPLIRIEGWRE